MGLFSRNSDVVCKCNSTKTEEVIASIKNGADTYEKVKEVTGAGEGRCKGMRCKGKIEKLIEENK